jgi:hypothetical protein
MMNDTNDQEIPAYHGSPYDFDQFSMDKIGTGEGAKAYGHGLYFAENEDVARSYRDRVSREQNVVSWRNQKTGKEAEVPEHISDEIGDFMRANGNDLREGDFTHKVENFRRWANDRETKQIPEYEEALRNAKPEHIEWLTQAAKDLHGDAARYRDAADFLETHRPQPKGNMYQVSIKAHPDHFLDWDKPLVEQSDYVKNAFIKAQTGGNPELEGLIDLSPESMMIQGIMPQANGSAAYKTLIEDHGSDKAATQKLRDAGIKGIKYLDGGSRSSGEGSRNYVIFDDSLVNVAKKYADGGAVDDNITLGDAVPYHQTPEFQNWFGDSVAHDDGVPRTYYHGTSKDVDFPSFKVGRHGVWLTDDPKEASNYAEENDSMDYKYEGGRFNKTNTASRVIPVHLKAERPYTGPMPSEFANTDNYKKAQSNFFDTLRSQGYDSWIPQEQGGMIAVALKDPTQVKSIYNRKFDPKQKRIDRADGGPVIENAVSVFPKPQRMFPDDAPVPGGMYLNAKTKEDMTGHKAAMASIGVEPGGKPYFHASPDEVDQTGTPGRGSAIAKTNLFKQRAGWRWAQAPEGHENTSTIVSVEHRGKHTYALNAHFPKGVDLARYENAPSEPRLRPTTRGNVELGPQVGSILVRGKEHPVHEHVIVRHDGGRVDPPVKSRAIVDRALSVLSRKS